MAQYKQTVAEVLKLAETNNFDIENLEYRKIDIGQQHTKPNNNCMISVVKASVRYSFFNSISEVLIEMLNRRKYRNPVRSVILGWVVRWAFTPV